MRGQAISIYVLLTWRLSILLPFFLMWGPKYHCQQEQEEETTIDRTWQEKDGAATWIKHCWHHQSKEYVFNSNTLLDCLLQWSNNRNHSVWYGRPPARQRSDLSLISFYLLHRPFPISQKLEPRQVAFVKSKLCKGIKVGIWNGYEGRQIVGSEWRVADRRRDIFWRRRLEGGLTGKEKSAKESLIFLALHAFVCTRSWCGIEQIEWIRYYPRVFAVWPK